MPLLRILAGPDGEDEGCRSFALGDPGAVSLSSLRVIDLRGNGLARVSDELQAAQGRVAAHLRGLGATIESPRLPELRRSFEIWAAMLSEAEGNGKFCRLLERSGTVDILKHLGLWAVGRSPHTFPALALGLVEDVGAVLPGLAARSVERGRALRAQLTEAMGDHGVMLYPSFSRTAPEHCKPARNMIGYSAASSYASLINVLEFPSTQVPMGLSAQGLPLGVQVVSTPGNDHLTIAVAMELERAFGGWTTPPWARA